MKSWLIALCLIALTFATNLPSYEETLEALRKHPRQYCGREPGSESTPLPPPSKDALAKLGNPKLKHVSLIIRHGDRSGYAWYRDPNDPPGRVRCFPGDTTFWNCNSTQNETPGAGLKATGEIAQWLNRKQFMVNRNQQLGNCGSGQLTMRGFKQHLENGAELFERYVGDGKLLPADLLGNTDKFYFRSTNYDRTRQSAAGILYGAFANTTQIHRQMRHVRAIGDDERCETDIVALNIMDDELETMKPNAKLCPQLGALRAEAMRTDAFAKFDADVLQPLFGEMKSVYGVDMMDYNTFKSACDCSWALYCHNKTMAAGFTPDLMVRMEAANTYAALLTYTYPSTILQTRVSLGFFLKELVDGLKMAAEDKMPEFALYSGHDTTIYPILIAWNRTDLPWTAYASTLYVELYTNDNEPVAVRLVYKNEVLRVDACGRREFCTWDEFLLFNAINFPTAHTTKDCAVTPKQADLIAQIAHEETMRNIQHQMSHVKQFVLNEIM